MTGEILKFRAALLAWYGENARDLPWRHTRDPYIVWVSEIMLQQTRVATVVEYFGSFIKKFPTLVALARASEASVLAQWSGLGYYRRARMLHRAARMLMADYDGFMPKTAAVLRELPGVGDYTAAAVASISYGEAVPVVDGNVERVLLRLYGPQIGEPGGRNGKPSQRNFREAALRLLDPQNPGNFNQAMMELGATVCLPRGPLCGECPVQGHCRTRGEHVTAPAKQMRSRRTAYALVVRNAGKKAEVLLKLRAEDEAQMPGMWELPIIEGDLPEEPPVLTLRHAITNTNYYVTIYALPAEEKRRLYAPRGSLKWVKAGSLPEMPLTGLARKVLRRMKIFPGIASSGWR